MPDTPPLPAPDPVRGDHPRQARALATRAAILGAAAEEFGDAGYHAASLSRILERSHVTKGALYFHFASKERIATAIVDEMESLCRAIEARSHDWGLDPLRTAARLAREVQDALAASPILRAGQRLSSEGYAGPGRPGWPFRYWQDVFAALFARAACDGLIHADVDPAGLGRFVADVSAGAFITSLGISDLADLSERVRHNWELLFTAVAVPEWQAGWRAEGGMAAVLGPHLAPGAGGWVPPP